MQSLEKNWLLAPKMRWAICWILMWAVASLKICTLMCYFCRNYIMLEPKKYRGVMYHNTEEWCKIWRGTELCFDKWPNTRKSQNLHFNELLLIRVYIWKLSHFDPTLESLKICILMSCFWSEYIMFEMKNYRGLTQLDI